MVCISGIDDLWIMMRDIKVVFFYVLLIGFCCLFNNGFINKIWFIFKNEKKKMIYFFLNWFKIEMG